MLDGLNYGMMGGLDGLLYQFGTGVAGIMAVVAIVLGAIQCYFGYKVFKILMAITGFFAGCGLGGALGAAILMENSGGGGIVVLVALIGGIIGVVIAVKVYFLGVFLYGFALGVLIGFLLSGEILPGMVLGIIVGVLLVIFDRLLIIIATTISGGGVLGMGVSALFYSMGMAVNSAISTLLSILFIATGLYYQFKVNGGLPSIGKPGGKRQKSDKAMAEQGNPVADGLAVQKIPSFNSNDIQPKAAFCEECGSQLEPNSAFCSNCGARFQ